MKKIYCDLHLFDLHQSIYVVSEDGERQLAAMTTMEELPEVISAICDANGIEEVCLSGNSVFAKAVGEDVLTYSLIHYSKNHIRVEVI